MAPFCKRKNEDGHHQARVRHLNSSLYCRWRHTRNPTRAPSNAGGCARERIECSNSVLLNWKPRSRSVNQTFLVSSLFYIWINTQYLQWHVIFWFLRFQLTCDPVDSACMHCTVINVACAPATPWAGSLSTSFPSLSAIDIMLCTGKAVAFKRAASKALHFPLGPWSHLDAQVCYSFFYVPQHNVTCSNMMGAYGIERTCST